LHVDANIIWKSMKNASFSTENKLPEQARAPRSKDDQTSTEDNQNIANEPKIKAGEAIKFMTSWLNS
jgi:hypothetical protein